MDFSKFTFAKKYTRYDKQFELFFDFDLKEITGHNRKTFDYGLSLRYFLESNPGKQIFLTLTQVPDFYEESDKLVINLRSYQDFCKKIGQNGKNKTQAFLAQKLKHYSESEKKEIIAGSTGKEIIERTKDFTEDQKTELIKANVTEANIFDVIKILDTETQNKILDFLQSRQGTNVSGKIIETIEGVLNVINGLTNVDPDILKTVLNKLNEREKIDTILETLSRIEMKHLSAANKQKIYQAELNNLKQLLELEEGENIIEEIKKYESLNSYIAGQPEKIFQKWIEQNLWVFGIEYIKKHDGRKVALFSEGDLLMESMDGFLDLIELKRPKYGIFQHDASHNSYYASPDLSKVIGQCLLYLQKMDDQKLVLEKEHKVKILRPRIKIIAGRTNDFKDEQFEALRMLNSNLNHIQIISYDYLLSCGRKIISLYEN